ncbi:aspartyl-phosphate phosphatase Spo0E family protein [Lysinibacillus sp. BW-2-10]|uniref:aspartyl-phosphate phosphatase Spo0E family protein n=1 Tax=Lysinibacillus sp. BW-2-10 TaxID=2590030 RepID=UPI001181501C|nr:aspartyl-phosphate phosphatase Spo0E family protein [Lysinibacillus sp. BW-2-10]TSI07380.1 aspartyl-phosphate phosphatase Spo0E family protein [Lysinibacillus sp. BW-2-10]
MELCSNLEIETEILKLQERMIDVVLLKGLTHPETIKYSQELDVMMNYFQNISSDNK